MTPKEAEECVRARWEEALSTHDELVENFVNDLFRNGVGQEAERLVLTTPEGRDLGGWCRKAVSDRVFGLIAELKEHAK